MRALLAIAALLAATAAYGQASSTLIFGGEGHAEFLGCLNCVDYASNSVNNKASKYSWANRYGIWGPTGPYRDPYGRYSACNEHAEDPPILVGEAGDSRGRLTTSPYTQGSVCGIGVNGDASVCSALRAMCAT